MFKQGDAAYFVFRGDFRTGIYKNFFCLPTSLKYFPFYPVIINQKHHNRFGVENLQLYNVSLANCKDWNMPGQLLEKEFLLDKFLLARVNWGGKMTKADYIKLSDAIRAGSSNGRTGRS